MPETRFARDDVLVVADDLTGAAETASALFGADGGAVFLRTPAGDGDRCGTVIDADTRHAPRAEAMRRTASALAVRRHASVVLLKIDSLLRGPIPAAVDAVRAAGRHPIVAPALPALGRTVRGGVVHLGGVPLAATSAWAGHHGPPPPDIATAAGLHRPVLLPLEVVRDPRRLRRALADAARAGRAAICDGESTPDVEAVVDAAVEAAAPTALVGSSALARALCRLVSAAEAPPPPPRHPVTRALVVAGSVSSGIPGQLAALAESGASCVVVAPADLADATARARLTARIAAASASRLTAVAVDPRHPWHRDQLAPLAAALAPTVDAGTGLVLTGGETARRLLDALGVAVLRLEREVGHGEVVLRTPSGTPVALRPGGFGGPASLREMAQAVLDTGSGRRTFEY